MMTITAASTSAELSPVVAWSQRVRRVGGFTVPEDVVGVIRDPRLDGTSLRYSFKVLEGSVPAAAGPCTLFIDPFGRPLSPVSVAGMHRRSRRRARR